MASQLFSPRSIALMASISLALSCSPRIGAQPSTPYKIPEAAPPTLAENPDTQFLKRFSKVFSGIAQQTQPALVLILAEKKVSATRQSPFDDFFFPFAPPGSQGGQANRRPSVQTDAGSGFVIDLNKGYVITNNHVINGAEKITVSTYDNRKLSAKLVGTAENLDIAVLQIEDIKKIHDSLQQLGLADSDKVETGDWVMALGAPFELPQTVTVGVVSAVSRSSDVLGIDGPNKFIQTDAAINPGNSGGPLVNLDGQVIGMNTAIYSRNGTNVGIGFAIPSNTIRLVADSLINYGRLVQAYLGVEMLDIARFNPNALKELGIPQGTEGGLVMRLVPDSPAAKAGLQPYDVIQSVNGAKVTSPSDIQSQIMFLKPGTSVKLGVLRAGKPLTLNAQVAQAPVTPTTVEANSKEQATGQPGEKSLAARYGLDLSEATQGKQKVLKITRITPNSRAARAGLEMGDVILKMNNKEVSSLPEAEKAFEAAQKSEAGILFLLIDRAGAKSGVALQLGNS